VSRKSRRDKQCGRRSLDHRAMMSLDGDVLKVKAYTDHASADAGRVATPEQGAAGEVTLYDVTCTAPLPLSAREAARGITTRFDVSGSGYPLTAPLAVVTSPRKPFTTHVQQGSGIVCLGSLWGELKGKELLAELVLRVMRAFNYQDPATNELGFQPDAFHYRQRLGRPFNAGLVLPAVPDEVFQVEGAASEQRPRVAVVATSASATRIPPRLAVGRPTRVAIVSGGRS